jgi:hypothetical protein
VFPSLAATLPEYGIKVNSYFMVVFDFCDSSRSSKDTQAGVTVIDNASNLDAVFHADTIGGMLAGVKIFIFGVEQG